MCVIERHKIVCVPEADSDNRRWMPGCITRETYKLYLPTDIPAGEYELKVAMKDKRRNIYIQLGFKEELTKNDLYSVGEIILE
ncbi:MAG: hypothetical protein GX094_03390 [Clostridiales bacterium]|jgi:hypothetical protein|nr:hypothetical protein [Clostridiales bacterium]